METLKQEILTEMRREMNKMKTEIIDGKFIFTYCILLVSVRSEKEANWHYYFTRDCFVVW